MIRSLCVQQPSENLRSPGKGSGLKMDTPSLLAELDEPSAETKPSSTCESHLQSLGFVVQNGKPRFQIGEPVYNSGAASPTDFSVVDADNTLSFVVLGKTSLDTIQAATQASLVDIQQKSMSIDYNTVLSSLNAGEIQQKLGELLKENAQLKETLRLNNEAMKQQFNTLATWQEEVMKVHQTHKQKFAETRELVNHLRKENGDLKLKLSVDHDSNDDQGNKPVEPLTRDEETAGQETRRRSSVSSSELGEFRQLLQDIRKCLNLSDQRSVQLKQAARMIEEQNRKMMRFESLVSAVDASDFEVLVQPPMDSPELQKWMADCDARDRETSRLKTLIVLLEKKLHEVRVELPPVCPRSQNRQQFAESVKLYGEKLRSMTEGFAALISRYNAVQECLKESADILERCELSTKPDPQADEWCSLRDNVASYCSKLSDCHRRLNDEQLRIIEDRQSLIKAADQFQKLFSDYNSIVYELEIVQEENRKLSTMRESAERASLERVTEMERSFCRERESLVAQRLAVDKAREEIGEQKKVLEERKRNLEEQKRNVQPKMNLEEQKKELEEPNRNTEERRDPEQQNRNLERQKKELEEQKKELEEQKRSLLDERELLKQERENLHGEKTSLDKQSQLYESHERSLQVEKRTLEKRCEELAEEVKSLREQLDQRNEELGEHKQNVELLIVQLEQYKEDFEEERTAKVTLKDMNLTLNLQLQRFVEANRRLEEGAHPAASSSSVAQSTESGQQSALSIACPVCHEFFSSGLEEHIETCLNNAPN